MIFTEFIANLYALLDQDLPGEQAHKIMAPFRSRAKAVFNSDKEPRLSAVMLLLYPVDFKPHFCLMQRNEYNGVHSGQISIPGGTMEDFDVNLRQTALREFNEEMGIAEEDIQVLGQLSEIYIPPSNFMVTPFIGFADKRPNFKPDRSEVAEVIEVPLKTLLNEDIVKQKYIDLSNGMQLNAPFFDIQEKVVWGATAAILSELKEMLRT